MTTSCVTTPARSVAAPSAPSPWLPTASRSRKKGSIDKADRKISGVRMVRPIVQTARSNLCEECQQRRAATSAVHQSRHVPASSEAAGPASYRLCTVPANWPLVVILLCLTLGIYWALETPCFCRCLLVAIVRVGPVHEAMRRFLPPIHSLADYENRHYRVQQSLWLVSLCSGIYTLLPAEWTSSSMQGWKMNLVTMETSMASGIAATYGYSVAGGVPGGLLAEFVIPHIGKATVAELEPYLSPSIARFFTSFGLFQLTGSLMECVVITAYAFAHRAPHQPPHPMTTGASSSSAPNSVHNGKQQQQQGHRRANSTDDGPAATSAGVVTTTPKDWSPWPSPRPSPSPSPSGPRSVGPLGSLLHGGSAPATSATQLVPDLSLLPTTMHSSKPPPRSPSKEAVTALRDFSHSLPSDYRKGYGAWRTGKARGAKGEPGGSNNRTDKEHHE